MKKLLLATLLIRMVSSCEQPTTVTKPSEHVVQLDGVGGTQLKVVVIEECEYFVGTYGQGGLFAHKANCKNPIHPENKGGNK